MRRFLPMMMTYMWGTVVLYLKRLKNSKDAFVLIGLPASGKSGIAVKIAQKYGAIILDSDFAKRKLPEFDKYPWGPSIVHAESSLIVFGDEIKTGFNSLYAKALQNNYNVVIPKIAAEAGRYYTILRSSKKRRL